MIQSVDRAARLLKALGGEPPRLGVSDLSERVGLAKGTVHGLLRTLRAHGLVEQDAESGKYQLGPALVQLSNKYLELSEIRSRSLAWSELLAVRANEAVRVGSPHGRGVLVVHHVFRPDSSLQVLEVGAVLPIHASALGKAILAYLPAPERDAVLAEDLPRLTGHTLPASGLRHDLKLVAGRRFAVEREEAILGEAAIAAPLFDRPGDVVGAVGITGPNERLLERGRDDLPDLVIEAARGISRDLGCQHWPPRT